MNSKQNIYIKDIYGWKKIKKLNNTLWIKGIIYNYTDIQIFKEFTNLKRKKLSNFLNTIDGHFAIIFENEERIISAVDQLASIPIFYYLNSNKFLISPFASKIRNNFQKKIDKKQILSLSMSSYTTGINTIYQNLYSIKAGTFINFSKRSKLVNKYIFYEYKNWKIDNHSSFKKKKKQLSKLHIKIINKIYKYSIKNKKKIGIPLSAGYDSRLIASCLKKLGAKNVFCFSYGYKNNFEALASEKISKNLGYSWEFITFTNNKIFNLFNNNKFKKFRSIFDTFFCVSDLTEFLAIKELYEQKKLRNTIIINGNSGDFITGDHIVEYKISKNPDISIDNLLSAFINKHFMLWKSLSNSENNNIIKKLLINEIKNKSIFKKINNKNSHSLYEYLEYYNRQSKHLSSKQRVYEYFDCEWALPLWDKDYIEFWRTIKKEYKINQKLYKSTIRDDNFGGVWKTKEWEKLKDKAKTSPLLFRFIIRPLFKFLFIFKGKEAFHKFETRYIHFFTDIICGMGIKKYYDLIRDKRGFRNCISLHTEDYLLKKKIKII